MKSPKILYFRTNKEIELPKSPKLCEIRKYSVMRMIEKAPANLNIHSLDRDRLTTFIFDQEFNDLVTKVNENYSYWDKVKYVPTTNKFTPQDVWLVAKIRRLNTPFKISFGKYNFSWFLNARIQEMLHLFDMNIGGSLEARSLIPSDEKNRYLISSIMEEAIASSQIEGAVTTRRQAKEMLRKNISPKNKSEQMIVNNYKTIQRILEMKDEPLTIQNLMEVHQLVSFNTLEGKEEEGSVRKSNDIKVIDVIDGEVIHHPPDAAELNDLLNELCTFFNNDSKDLFVHPIIKACIIHFMIGFIHPFTDGNGRTARALFYWYLLKKGYWLTEYLSISRLILRSKEQYARAFIYTEVDDNDLTYFISYKLRTMRLAYNSLREYIQRKLDEKRQVSEFIKLEGVNERQALILKWLYEEPSLLLTVREVETRLAIANQTARTDLQDLVHKQFLEIISMNKKTQAFVRSNDFERLIKRKRKSNHRDNSGFIDMQGQFIFND